MGSEFGIRHFRYATENLSVGVGGSFPGALSVLLIAVGWKGLRLPPSLRKELWWRSGSYAATVRPATEAVELLVAKGSHAVSGVN